MHFFIYKMVLVLLICLFTNPIFTQENIQASNQKKDSLHKIIFADDTKIKDNSTSIQNPLTPKHRLNTILMYEIEERWKVGLEAVFDTVFDKI